MSKPSQRGEDSVTADDIRGLLADPKRVALVAQPIVDLRRGEIVGYEALSRFTLPSNKPAYPDRVFAAAVKHGLGPELEAVVIREALELAKKKPANTFLDVNIDPLHVDAEPVLEVVRAFGDLGGIIFELTEHSIADLASVRRAVQVLRRYGAMIAIDDAGAGYSGLKQIVELQPQFIKIDRDLVTGIYTNEAKRALVHTLGELAARLDAWVIAEGIETDEDLSALKQLNVPLGQGYYLARPNAPWCALTSDSESSFTKSLRSGLAKTHPISVSLIVEHVVERPSVCSGQDEWPDAAVSVRVDKHGRPIELRIANEDGARLRMEYDFMRVSTDTTVAELAMRVSARPERLRWDPVVCIDELGRFEGIVPVQRILSELGRSVSLGGREPARFEDEQPSRTSLITPASRARAAGR